MTQNSPNLDLPFLQPSQAQKHVTHNEALRRLDIVVQLRLQQTGATIPPAAPDQGDTYAVGAGATGDWAGQNDMLAAWLDAGWQFIAPQTGWRAWDEAAQHLMVWDGSDWIAPRPDLENLDGVGIGTVSDNTNRLAVQSPATLLSHSGQGHQLKINKAAEEDTASLLFQSNWTGHAELGLTGQNAFSIKLSDDGATWTEALRLNGETGHASGSAIQTDSVDATEGRLMTVGAFGLGTTGTGTLISDIEASDTPAGLYRFISTTTGADDLPSELQNSYGSIRIERNNTTRLRQTAWRNSFDHGIWTRSYLSGTWGDWRQIYDQSTILGPVSQSAGVPTGAIIERGASTDGDYVRFADGTQICTKLFDTEATGHVWTFPAAFAVGETPVLQATPRHATAPRIVTEHGDLSATGVTFNVWDSYGGAVTAAIHATATGRWF